jgi:hypothetical protein
MHVAERPSIELPPNNCAYQTYDDENDGDENGELENATILGSLRWNRRWRR